MMTYIQNHNSTSKKSARGAAIIVLLLLLVIGAIRFLLPNTFAGLLTAIARPFWRVEYSISSGQLQSAEALLGANQELLRKLDDADVKLQSVSAVLADNEQLKSLMGRASTTDGVLAAVLKKPPYAPYDELILDAGSDMGFAMGDMVYASGNVPIGKISEVLAHSSKVLLFSSPGQTFNVLVGKSNVPAAAIGRGGGQYGAELPRTIDVSEGDFVSIPSLKSNLYGTINAVISDPSQPFETILFSAPVNIYQLRWVLVGKTVISKP